jgi:hypothetical protein
MPTKFHAGQRVVHATLGQGTVVETEGDSCRVELDSDDGARVRTFMISLGTLCPVDALLINHDASQTITLPTKPEESPMPDVLLTAMNAAIAERGKGSGAALCATLGLAAGSYKNWRTHGRIPENHQAGVQAWIDKPTVTAIRVEKTKAAPKTKPKPKLRLVEQPAAPLAAPLAALDHETVLRALGLTTAYAWLPDGDTMRQVRVAVLP